MEPWLATLVIFSVLIILLLLGLPIAFTLGGIGVIFTLLLWGSKGLPMISSFLHGEGMNFILTAVPLFILMANFLEASGIAEALYDTMYRWLHNIPGGLASGTVIICAVFAAMAGISGVATITMGLIAIPSMLRHGYDKRLTTGTVAAGGALGILIPPSIIAILYGSITGTSVGGLFMGGLIPGLLLAVLFIVYITVRCLLQPKLAPSLKEKVFTWPEKIQSLKGIIFPFILIFLVLSTIYLGICTPTESAAIGAFGSIICCAIYRKLSWQNVKTATLRTFNITVMAVWIVFGAASFQAIYTVGGASQFILGLVSDLAVPPIAMIGIMMFIWFFLGMFMDPVGMLMITIPVFSPIVSTLGFDSLWFGILFIISSEMAYITPPFGFNLFYMKAIVPSEISMVDIYRSITPFIFCQVACLILVIFFPQIALWLPAKMAK